MEKLLIKIILVLFLISSIPIHVNAMTAFEEELYYDSLGTLAALTAAEAIGETEYGQRLVIDVVLNRVDSDKYPDDIRSVIYQKNQFTPSRTDFISTPQPTEQIYRLVMEEINHRTNSQVLYFQSGGYSKYGVPLFKCGNHYFSK